MPRNDSLCYFFDEKCGLDQHRTGDAWKGRVCISARPENIRPVRKSWLGPHKLPEFVGPVGRRPRARGCWRPTPGPCAQSFLLTRAPDLEVRKNLVLGNPFRGKHLLQARGGFFESCSLRLRPFMSGRNVVANGIAVPRDGHGHVALQEITSQFLPEFANPNLQRFHASASLCTYVYTNTIPLLPGRLKLGYYPLPVEEAQNIRALLMSSAPYSAIDPCVGDGTALLEIIKDTGAHLAGVELDAGRAAAAAQKGITTVHGIAFECRVLAETCSLLYLNPPYDSELGPHSNQRMEFVFLEHCFRWVITEGVLVFVIPVTVLGACARLVASQFERISVFRLEHPESVRFKQIV